jgi:phosphatidylglycerol---prolipoprotein diacylglyceryl transferase
MNFPVYLEVFGRPVHPHLIFEVLGYLLGGRLYFALRRQEVNAGTALPMAISLWLLVGCIFGAWTGSKLLAWAESPQRYLSLLGTDPAGLLGAKTIVGGLLGGWAGIELAKLRLGIVRSTGDLFVYPLALGTAVGRVGCFLTGLADHTFGTATLLPWAVNFGDGVPRHPTQLYESACVIAVALGLHFATRQRTLPSGVRFRLYCAAYFGFRFLVEFIKPRESLWLNLSAIQCASLTGVLFALISLRRLYLAPQSTPDPQP